MEKEAEKKKVDIAEQFLWDVCKRELEARGHADAAMYLQHSIKARLIEVSPEGAYAKVSFAMHHRFSEYSAHFNAATGEATGWFFDALTQGLKNSKRETECLKAAEYFAKPPADAKLTVAEYEVQSNSPVFVARWEHVHKGVLVERDFIQVLVNGGSGYPFALHRRWHSVDL